MAAVVETALEASDCGRGGKGGSNIFNGFRTSKQMTSFFD
eukprot:CAMPEP_0171295440 /NCGR_PEP_ID=MMETSP0816-20121228/3997_1 /TAXON_ID=420281 /ORGANISM="Proboscia inermis, Strain CCAP1064/1" /LENGTH=39 /DNA_ID= /DNA_START= /DNA_END= /DNA_ORIENTATION=